MDMRTSIFRRHYPCYRRPSAKVQRSCTFTISHGGYFDLRALPALSHLTPSFLPSTTNGRSRVIALIHSGVSDGSPAAVNAPTSRSIPESQRTERPRTSPESDRYFSQTRLHLSAPSRWLMDRAEESLLAPAIEEGRVIPNGVDTAVFHPGDQRSRDPGLVSLSIHRSSCVLDRWSVHITGLIRCSFVQPFSTLRRIGWVAQSSFLGSPEYSQEEVDGIQVIHQPYERDTSRVASYYRAADVYLHPARADTFPTTVIESLACGLPVVATSVGGIPEQVRSLWATTNAPGSPLGLATGILSGLSRDVGPGESVEKLLHDEPTRRQLSENGSRAAVSEFDITHQVEHYLDWYRQILNRRHPSDHPVARTPVQRRGLPR